MGLHPISGAISRNANDMYHSVYSVQNMKPKFLSMRGCQPRDGEKACRKGFHARVARPLRGQQASISGGPSY